MGELANFTDADVAFKLGIITADPLPPIPVDAIFIPARAAGDNDGILEHAALMYKLGLSPRTVIIGNEGQKLNDDIPQGANPGKSFYRSVLEDLGVPSGDILHIADVPNERHTRGESLGFLRLARENNWTSAVMPTQPHQSWRALAGTISGMRQLDYQIPLFYVRPLYTPWQAVVRGSQGQDEKFRMDHFENEGDRITFYSTKITPENQIPASDFPDKEYLKQLPDIATTEEILDYIRWREEQVNGMLKNDRPFIGSSWIYQKVFDSLK